MGSLREWLQSIGLEHRSEKLHGNDIDMDIVASRDDNDLRELGLTLGDRKRFLAASAKLARADASVNSKTPSRVNAGERRQLTQHTHAFESIEPDRSSLSHADDLIQKDIDLVQGQLPFGPDQRDREFLASACHNEQCQIYSTSGCRAQ